MASYVCFVTDTENCLQGGSAEYFNINTAIIQSQESWFTNNGGNCNFGDSSVACLGGSFNDVSIYSFGETSANDTYDAICCVINDGRSYCSE